MPDPTPGKPEVPPSQGDRSQATAAPPPGVAPDTIDLSRPTRDLTLFVVAGEHSGDALGAKLMAAIKARRRGGVRFLGVGGPAMEAEGLGSQFPLSDVAVMGPLAILKRLPKLVARVHQTVSAAIAANPDAVIIIDSPEFTHPIAKRIRRRRPDIPIVDYVSPSVWAWRPRRAQRMRRYIDHVMALLPFEPEVHARLGGPPCAYVGHPLIEHAAAMRDADPAPLRARLQLAADETVLLVLPGSRRSEVERLMQPFGVAVARLASEHASLRVLIPAVEHVRPMIEAAAGAWAITPTILAGETEKLQAFKLARAALAASGTVTLELALAGTPMVVAYRVDPLAARLRFLVRTPHFALANLVLGERAFPELMQEDCEPERLAAAIAPLLVDSAERDSQLAALARIPPLMHLPAGTPSEAAARIVVAHAERGRRR